jgi:hypothetical protein
MLLVDEALGKGLQALILELASQLQLSLCRRLVKLEHAVLIGVGWEAFRIEASFGVGR